MANQQVSKIEDFAFDYLKNYYTQQCYANNILVGQSEKTKRGNTTDGILAFKQTTGNVFVANISMQQSEALTNLVVNYKKNGLGWFRLITPLLVAAACFFIGRSTGNLLIMLIAPVIFAPFGFILHAYLLKKYRFRQVEKLVDQAKQYPANDQWIGLSISSLMFRKNLLATELLEVCNRKGVGLITVGQRSKVIMMKKPKSATCRRGDFLSHYASDENIRKAIEGDHVLRVA
ncbi:hypothetical protein H8S95_14725 [Pontibacter sp. KCTC 32443]|uniref:hypothetical protein n=1 Tax=Pontibacter TaxID=323449 RepID=UPI00164E8BF7|nr:MULTISPECIES: hypothetical protein [Pontibacter]MBC5775331.1 hypothetical protein [Pontibacter sp. KCTC 32443]